LVRGYDESNQGQNSDIRNYYMSDSLLSMELGDSRYNEVIDQAVFAESGKESAAYVTAKTKAFFKDGNA
jgi:hypothetical protein